MTTCSEFSPLLSPLLDDELTSEARARVTDHVTACSACANELAAIRRGRGLARAVPDMDMPADLSFHVLAGRKAHTSRQARVAGLPLARPAIALGSVAAVSVLAVTLWVGRSPEVPRSSDVQQIAAARPLHLAQLLADIGSGQDLDTVAAQYQLRRVDLEAALKENSFKVICPLHQAGSDDPHVRELRDCPLIHLSALRGDQEIVLLQQPAGWPIVYGDAPVHHLTFGGEPCDRLRTDGRELFKWERGDTRWILVARAGHPEAEKVVSTLLSSAS